MGPCNRARELDAAQIGQAQAQGYTENSAPPLIFRVLAAAPRSGSTLFMRFFREVPNCAVTSRLVFMGNYDKRNNNDEKTPGRKSEFEPDYSIFYDPSGHPVYQKALRKGCSFLVSKEELGHEKSKGECDYAIFPCQASYDMSRPAFLFRDPLRVFDSWKKLGWGDMDSFVACYANLYGMWDAHRDGSAVVVYEELARDPEGALRALCAHWGVPFSRGMLDFKHPFGDFVFLSDRERGIYNAGNPLGIFDTVASRGSVDAGVRSHGLLSKEETEAIEAKLGPLYIDAYGGALDGVVGELRGRTWFGFDLDDTLHEFRRASGAASTSVFERVAGLPGASEVTVEGLRATYSSILAEKTSGAFADGKTSDAYRKERFAALMAAHSVPFSPGTLDALAAVYRESLEASLTLKPGAAELLGFLKGIGKKTVLVTEGPEDAQAWTVEKLGIAGDLDVVVTSNKFGMPKTGGLFPAVLRHLGIEGGDMVYVGDNFARDVEPARAEGILAVHFDEKENVRFGLEDFKINSLKKLVHMLK